MNEYAFVNSAYNTGLKAIEALAQLEKERGNPAGIIAPAIVETFFSTLTAIIYCKVMDMKRGRNALRL